MEITVELDESLVDELDEEAQLQGFDDRGAYLRWVIANRPMSELATTQAPAVASRVSELEERMKLVERQLDLSAPTDAADDLADGTTPSSSGSELAGEGGGASLEGSGGGGSLEADSGGASLDEPVEQDTDPVDLEDPTAGDETDEEEDGAQDDEIAEAIDEIDLEDEEEEDGADSEEADGDGEL